MKIASIQERERPPRRPWCWYADVLWLGEEMMPGLLLMALGTVLFLVPFALMPPTAPLRLPYIERAVENIGGTWLHGQGAVCRIDVTQPLPVVGQLEGDTMRRYAPPYAWFLRAGGECQAGTLVKLSDEELRLWHDATAAQEARKVHLKQMEDAR